MEFNSRRICRKLFVIVVILCALFLVKFELLNGSGHSHLSTEEFFKLINAEYGPARILEKFQMEDGTFLYIVDMIGLVYRPERNKNRTEKQCAFIVSPCDTGRKSARKEVLVSRCGGNVKNRLVVSVIERHSNKKNSINPPFIRTKSERSLRSIDTSRWKVDKTYLPRNGVLHYMAEAIFYADAVELSRDCQANVLSLGLGGGQVNGFLHQNFPKMNITVVDISAQMLRMAKKWFDLQSDDHHRVILDDGARFVEEQAAKGVKYDAIILDACHSAPRTGIELICPVKVFLQKRVIRSISQLLTDGGIIVMNAAAATIRSEDVRSMLRYHFHKFFNYCGHRKSAGFNQAVVIVCIIVWLKSVFFDSRVHLSTVEFFNLISETYGDSRDLFTVLRRIDIESGGGTHSTFYLITPAEHSPRNIDTSRWEVDKAYLFPTSYYHYMAEVLFYANAIELSRDSKANVLSLGLGGGQLNGFLHHNFPKLNITVVELSAQMVRMARKWFNLQTDDHHRVIVDDGVRFVEKEAAKGAKYDALMVDACYANPREEITMCPVRIFLQEHIARSISQVISSRGILIMNVVSISPSPGKLDEAVAVVRKLYSKFFSYCAPAIESYSNRVFYCMHQQSTKEGKIDILEFVKNTS